jgi:hypothetical protein
MQGCAHCAVLHDDCVPRPSLPVFFRLQRQVKSITFEYGTEFLRTLGWGQ